ncbi:MAG: zf-HC2 domain-containing protein [Lachnospiraceae bacterium]|nr:zf-HC2 domain-containing protein [Lachnospiraceae bacterium]MDD3615012.1 zf-HC2 domain-containing protein [Lachnospiraceae bacterium]
MDCKEAESHVNDYIDGTMTVSQLETFLKHVRNCKSCYDELETYYTIRVAMSYLEEGQAHSYNIKEMLSEDMKGKDRYIFRVKQQKIGFGSLTTVAFLSLFVMLFMRLNPEQVREILELTYHWIGF